MANTIDDLRSHLFDTLAALKDKDKPMDLDRARTVADVAKVLIDSAKVEVEFLKVTGTVQSTGFLPAGAARPKRVAPAIDGPVARAAADALIPAGDRCVLCGVKLTSVRSAAQCVYDTFVKDEAAGYRSRDRQFAIEILGQALGSSPSVVPICPTCGVPCVYTHQQETQP